MRPHLSSPVQSTTRDARAQCLMRISPQSVPRQLRRTGTTSAITSAMLMTEASITDLPLTFRQATRSDVPDIVRMLADDPLGARRESFVSPLPDGYFTAFDAIRVDPNNELVVACIAERVVGVLQMTFIPYLTYRGSWRALIEGVRVDASIRSRGAGRKLFEWAIERAAQRGCHLIQLTSDKARPDAIRFYESLGFVASHEGLKLHLDASATQP